MAPVRRPVVIVAETTATVHRVSARDLNVTECGVALRGAQTGPLGLLARGARQCAACWPEQYQFVEVELRPSEACPAGSDSPPQPRTAPGAMTTARGRDWAHVATQAVGGYL